MATEDRARLRTGDPGAFGRIWDDHARSLYNHAFRLCVWPGLDYRETAQALGSRSAR